MGVRDNQIQYQLIKIEIQAMIKRLEELRRDPLTDEQCELIMEAIDALEEAIEEEE